MEIKLRYTMKRILQVLALVGGGLLGMLSALAALMLVVKAPGFPFFALGLIALEWAPWVLLLACTSLVLIWSGRRAAGSVLRYGLLGLSGLALLVLGGNWAMALWQPPVVTTNIDALAAQHPGSFEWASFLRSAHAADVRVLRDVVYDRSEGQALTLDVYTPPGHTPDKAVPGILVVHGGSWREGDKGNFAEQSALWAAEGYVVFDIAYRLAPRYRFPTAVQDVQCALSFVAAGAGRFGLDPGRIAIVGRSAGAQIALVAAYAPAEPALAPRCAAPGEPIRAVLAYYAPTRMSYHDIIQPELSPGALDDYLGGSPGLHSESYRLARPFTWIGQDTPPTLLLHGRRDQFIRTRDPVELGEALAAAGRPYAVVLLPRANHGFDFNPTGTSSQQIQPYVGAFLKRFLSGDP